LGDVKGLIFEGWRLPFGLYGFGFILFFLCLFLIWTPSAEEKHAVQAAHKALEAAAGRKEEDQVAFSWGKMIPIYLVTFYVSTAFYVLLIKLAAILGERHYEVGLTIGTVMFVMSICMTLGAVIFKFMKTPVSGKMALSFAFSAIGFATVASSQHLLGVTIGSAITGFGSGMALPTMITYAISKLPSRFRARGMGIWQASFFVGQFASPLIITLLSNTIGGLSHAVLAYSGFMTVAFVLAIVTLIKGGGKVVLEEEA
jgi:MFS family permease